MPRFTSPRTLFRISAAALYMILVTTMAETGSIIAEEPVRNIIIEVYYRESDPARLEAIRAVEDMKSTRDGITVVLRDIENDPEDQKRLDAILKHFRIEPMTSPVIYGCNRVMHDIKSDKTWDSCLKDMLRVEVFVRSGCSRCAAAKRWLPQLEKEYPGLEFIERDIAVDPACAAQLTRLVEKHRTMAASVPVFYLCDTLIVGFQDVESTGTQLRSLLKRWTHVPRHVDSDPKNQPRPSRSSNSGRSSLLHRMPAIWSARSVLLSLTACCTMLSNLTEETAETKTEQARPEASADELVELPLPGDDLPEASGLDDQPAIPGMVENDSASGDAADEPNDTITLPLFGRLSASGLGMPLFTLAVGLVDGFNPCAMWVLLFLLSILVNLRDRRRILAIAGTFVVVSGLAYFAFMAAWLNIFLLVGYLRSIQIGLAVMAMAIGAIHVKDFFAFKQGISLSIPVSAKPGIYARVRRIVTAEHLTGAIFSTITLAVLVNLIELLCTAGLPALYTNILMQQGYSPVLRYACLGLYIVAYMFDDALMVAVVTVTMSRKKMQDAQGRWLKLVSGGVILALGVVMLFRPEWLEF